MRVCSYTAQSLIRQHEQMRANAVIQLAKDAYSQSQACLRRKQNDVTLVFQAVHPVFFSSFLLSVKKAFVGVCERKAFIRVQKIMRCSMAALVATKSVAANMAALVDRFSWPGITEDKNFYVFFHILKHVRAARTNVCRVNKMKLLCCLKFTVWHSLKFR